MPQVTINEIDQSRYLSVATRAPLIALTPVIASFGPTEDAVFVETESQYETIFGATLPNPIKGDITRNYAITLINSGVTLLAKRITPIVVKDGSISTDFNINSITSQSTYVNTSGNYSVQVLAKDFGTTGNKIAYRFSKVTLSSGALTPTGEDSVIYAINTYIVNNVSDTITPSADGLYIGTFDSTLTDYKMIDNFTLSTNPADDNYIGNTTYLNSQLQNVNVNIAFQQGAVVDYTAVLDTLVALTTENQAIVLKGGNDYFATYESTKTVTTQVTNETYTSGTALAHTPVVSGTFTGTVTDGTDTYTITEGTVTEGVVTLVCADIADFSGTLNYSTGVITLNNLPADSTVAMNYSYTHEETVDTPFTPEEIKKQFEDALSFQYGYTLYPKTSNKFWEAFTDHYVYDFDVVVSCGFTGLDNITPSATGAYVYVDNEGVYRYGNNAMEVAKTSNLHINMLRLASSRGDAVALIDTPQHWAYTDVYLYTELTGGYQPIYSYGAVHAPWCKMRDLSTGNYAMLPASLAFLGAVASGLVTNGESSLWYAPAGVARASCPNVVDSEYQIGGTILNYWQNTQKARVNPIMQLLSYGYCVYGNATLMQNMRGYTKSSLQSLGTRFLCNAIKKAIFSICVRLTFEPNDYNLWSTFRTELGDVLRQYQLNGVLASYSIVMDESTVTDEARQNLTVPGKVNIVPTLAAEYFDIDFTISAQGVTFSEQVLEEVQ